MEVTLDAVNMFFFGGKEAGLSISPTIDLLGFSQPSPVRMVQKRENTQLQLCGGTLLLSVFKGE